MNPGEEKYTRCTDDLSAASGVALVKLTDYVLLVSARDRVRIPSSQRVLDHPEPVAGGYLWASDHVGVLTVLRHRSGPAVQ